MKIEFGTDSVDVVDNLNFSCIIRETADSSYLLGRSEDPFYVCDLGNILNKHDLWMRKLPRVEPFYAMKCNPSPIVVKMLAKLKIGFDCASKGEISQILSYGVSADRIIYANPCKQASHIRYADSNGVKLMTFDSSCELHKILQFCPSAHLVLRIFVGATQARCPLGLKFGANMSDVPNLLSLAKGIGLKVVGVSFHVGSGCFDPSAYRAAIKLSKEVFDISQSIGISMSLLDIGGGFPGNFDSESNVQLFDDVCDSINTSLDELFPVGCGVRVISEPGRFYVSSAFHLSCTLTSVRSTPCSDDSSQEKISYFLNDGVYGSFNCVVFDHYIGDHYLLNDTVFGVSESEPTYWSTFWGPTCDSADKILEKVKVRRLSVGERIVFKNMGAYTMAAGCSFNGFQPPYVRYVVHMESLIKLIPLLSGDIRSFESSDSMFPGSIFNPVPIEVADNYAGVA